MYKTIVLDCQDSAIAVISCDGCIAYKTCALSRSAQKEETVPVKKHL
ncbi:MAG: hypothetical protein NWF01_08100 [Candidatus Bathyarchaeota archaeon]|nr:hypothetical protein [Candidatus Bathyarchaeota archaeon]